MAARGWLRYAVLICLLVPCAASAIQRVQACTHWTTWGGAPWFPTPEIAADFGENCCSTYPPSQLPVTITGCFPDGQGPVFQNCTGATRQGNPVAPRATGFGAPGAGVGWLTISGQTYCFANTDDPKNLGPCPSCGNPINIATGNKFQQEVDFPASGEGSLEFTRTYNALNPFGTGLIGTRWTHTWARSLFPVGTADMRAIRGDGMEFKFVLSGGVWTPDADVPYSLVPSGTQWQLTSAENEIEIYNAGGKLLSVTTPSGKVTTLTYTDGTR